MNEGYYVLEARSSLGTERLAAWCENKSEATFWAIKQIMDMAFEDKAGPWAVGEIMLTDPKGFVIHAMESKEGAATK